MRDKTIREYFLRLPAEERRIGEVREFVADVCKGTSLPEAEVRKIQTSAEEAFTNVIRHAYLFGTGWIQLKAEVRTSSVALSVIDQGRSFDFEAVEKPDLARLVARERKGGLGIFMIRTLMDEVDYQVRRDGNELRMVKYAERARPAAPAEGKRHLTLRTKFTLAACSLMTLVAGGIYAYVFFSSSRASREQVLEQGLAVSKSLAGSAVGLLVGPDRELDWGNVNLQVLAPRTKVEQPWAAYILIVGNDGIIYSHSQSAQLLTRYAPPPGVSREGSSSPRMYLLKEGSRRGGGAFAYDITVPVKLESGTRLGTVHLGILDETIRERIRTTRVKTLGVALGLLSLGIVAVSSISGFFVQPIQKLMDGVRTVGGGDLEHHISLQSDDEIGQIARAFNDMTRRFKNSQKNLVEQERLRKEMQVAQEIQQTLLPARFPEIEGYDIATLYRAAKEVGGDYYDFVWVNKDALGIVVADVSGKGVPGSLIMTMIRTAVRHEARGNMSAKDVLQNVNAFVSDDMKRGMFVTIFYVILDCKRRVINFASAGHNPMILYRAETGEAYFLNPPGVPLGLSLPDRQLFPETLQLERTRLKKDDLLIIYTDGVTEAMNRAREQFGEKRFLEFIKLNAHLSPSEFGPKLDEEIDLFTEGFPQSDDLTMVVIREKLVAEDLIARRWVDLFQRVEAKKLSLREAWEEMGVSASTYYHHRRAYLEAGEEGLRTMADRDFRTPRVLSLRERNRILEVVRTHPEFGPDRISQELKAAPQEAVAISPHRIYEELRRLKLSTRQQRLEFSRGNGRPVLHYWGEGESAAVEAQPM